MNLNKEATIVLTGAAGQGIKTIESLLAELFLRSGHHIFSTQEIMSRIKGGYNSTELIVSESGSSCFRKRIDFMISLKQGGLNRLEDRISSNTVIIHDPGEETPESITRGISCPVELEKEAKEAGNKIFKNVIAAGIIGGIFQLEEDVTEELIREYFEGKKPDDNIKAFKRGRDLGQEITEKEEISININKSSETEKHSLLNGTQAVGMGAVNGGCNFISSYPMSPSTGVLTYLAKHSSSERILVEQAEDEISAINMGLGAWYAGARAMVSTSGGGFALMEEGLSLSGMTETPIVIHLAQRPGPATGLPTRTEQGDLNMALYAGHGEFPRIIFSPGTPQQGLRLSAKAFDMADKYQVPVFILTDHYFLNSYSDTTIQEMKRSDAKEYTIKTDETYKRYAFSDKGISPRGIPGYGEGLVKVDSDEHDEEGYITEDFTTRKKMVEKRMSKLDSYKKDSEPPELIGSGDFKTLILCWGSTYQIVKEALDTIERNDISALFFPQVCPIPQQAESYLKKADRIFSLENNYTGQFGSLIQQKFGIRLSGNITQYNGLPFYFEDVCKQFESLEK